jgi:acetyltransferase
MSMPTPPSTELATDILRPRQQPLDVFFKPNTVAVIGATDRPNSVGRTVLWNLVSNPFGGVVFPINPKRSSVLGIQAYPNIAAAPAAVDLAVIVTPASTVPGIIGECIAAGVKGAVILSAGFKETGPEGAALERQVRERLQGGTMRVIGPNCLGVMNPHSGLNASFAAATARPGSVGFLSQSGALLTAILDWSLQVDVGFSAFFSVGSMLDVGWGALMDYLGDDPRTHSIVIYMESVGDARSFLSAAREVALRKPVIVLKAGRTEPAAQAAASHTGSLAGRDEVLDAAFRRSGVLRVNSISDLFYMADVLAKQPRPHGPRLTIVTNAGGPGVLATDALIAGRGELARLAPETIAALDRLLPPQWSRGNPIDILGDADPDRYTQAVAIAARDAGSDGILVVLTPQAMTDPTRTAEQLKGHGRGTGKPILASWIGGTGVAPGVAILNQAGIPTFRYPDTAARAFNYMWRYSYNLRALYETPHLPVRGADETPDRGLAERIIQSVRCAGRSLLTELESKQLLAAYGIPTVPTGLAAGEAEAVRCADEIGYPVVLKVHSETITHKTEVGGVRLNVPDAAAVRRAFQAIKESVSAHAGAGHFAGVTVQPMCRLDGYELILGSSIDPQFGPVLLFGAGGLLVEVLKDRALALPLLNTTLARRLMEQTRVFAALQGVRGRPAVDLAALEQLLVRFSHLVIEQHWIKEIDVNPLLASPERLLALDARMVVYGPDVRAEELPKPAIRPYPSQYVKNWTLEDGTRVTIRPIGPEDEPLMVKFHESLSEHSVYLRYFQSLKLSQRVGHERLAQLCFIDYDREIALVAERSSPHLSSPGGESIVTGQHEIIAIGRLIKRHSAPGAEFALVVSDRFQCHGLGTEMLRRLVQMGRDEGLARITAEVLPDNRAMARVCEKLGFRLRHVPGEPVMQARMEL